MTKKIQKYQIIKFDSFDFLILLILKKNLQKDRQTTDIWPYGSDLPSLKKHMEEYWYQPSGPVNNIGP